MRAIIIAAGTATRWANYLDTPKHLISIDGEPILYRTVRLLKENNVTDIHIVGPVDNRYKVDGCSLFVPVKNSKMHDADKFLNSETLWSSVDRTIILFGDVYFTENAINTIINLKENTWLAYGRFFGSTITGSKYGELFGHSFYPEHIDNHKKALSRVVNLVDKRLAKKGNGWEHYRAMQSIPDSEVRIHRRYDNFIEINDWTEDFDYPNDYDMWIERWNNR